MKIKTKISEIWDSVSFLGLLLWPFLLGSIGSTILYYSPEFSLSPWFSFILGTGGEIFWLRFLVEEDF